MTRILGIDTGTNSLGWAIVDTTDEGYRLIDRGSHIFQEGVKNEKGIESSKAAERTGHRALRVRYYRIKLRKLRLLRVMSDAGLCPELTGDELRAWRLQKVYPANEAFRRWQATDDVLGINPYAYRHRCLHERLDLSDESQRFILGRALYHIVQRRGFLSNRKDDTESKEDGTVKESISKLSAEMAASGVEFLGDYFYQLYQSGKRIRCRYTAREEHYLKEFRAICRMQQLDADLTNRLERAIFYQRPLKSQKHAVGKCVFEKQKPRCPLSHPFYEEFRMLSFLNNVKVKGPYDTDLRPLTEEERERALPAFFRKSKPNFDFKDIAEKIAGKGKNKVGHYKKDPGLPWLFNYYMDQSVAGCPVTAQLHDVLGEDWITELPRIYRSAADKTLVQMVNDVWQALCFFPDADRLAEWGRAQLGLSPDKAEVFAKIKLPQTYGSLSLRAITKILPFLRRGMIYSHAVFMANLGEVVPNYVWNIRETREALVECMEKQIALYDPDTDKRTLEACLKDYLRERFHLEEKQLDKLYHPSMTDIYPRAPRRTDGTYRLGSPRTDSVRNPMAMHSLFRLRAVVNRLLEEGKIDEHTEVHIELARTLNDANMRQAIERENRDNEKKRAENLKKIKELYRQHTGSDYEPTDTDLLKFDLWEEQGHKCIYTGREIAITDFLGSHTTCDIEHTIPRSVGGDSTKMNLTLCDNHFNRDIKRAKIPSQLDNHDAILLRIKAWKEKWEDLDKLIRKQRTHGGMTKDQKDPIIQRRHYLTMQRNYWRGKYERFLMTEVPEGFSRRQGTDINVISRYALAYLKTVFRHVYPRKGISTADFRKIWGLQDIYAKKERVNHVHHCIDAIVVACMGQNEYNRLAQFYHDEELRHWDNAAKPTFAKPWPTFVQDIKTLADEVMVAHYTADNMPKQGRRRITVGSQRVMSQGDAARGSLHNDTYYGAIAVDDEVRYVVRRPLDMLKEKDLKNIVDPTVRAIVEQAVAEGGEKALQGEVWMNKEKGVLIKKVRCYVPSVTRPLNIRQQRDQSKKEYKRQFHVANDRNYLIAIYEGRDAKGKAKREFEMVNMLDAARRYRRSADKSEPLVPETSKKGYPLRYKLKIGTMVLLYEEDPEEVWSGDYKEIARRLYKVTGMSSMVVHGDEYGRIIVTHQQEARPSTEVKTLNGKYVSGEDLRHSIMLYHTQFNALVAGVDFTINELGEITRIK